MKKIPIMPKATHANDCKKPEPEIFFYLNHAVGACTHANSLCHQGRREILACRAHREGQSCPGDLVHPGTPPGREAPVLKNKRND